MKLLPPQTPGSRTAALAFVASAIAIVAAPPASAAVEVADARAAIQIVSDSTIDFSHGQHHIYEYYGADGVSRAGDGTGMGRVIGHWKVRPDGTVCFLHDDPNQSGCVFVRMNGDRIEFHRIDGVVEGPFDLARGNPHGL